MAVLAIRMPPMKIAIEYRILNILSPRFSLIIKTDSTENETHYVIPICMVINGIIGYNEKEPSEKSEGDSIYDRCARRLGYSIAE